MNQLAVIVNPSKADDSDKLKRRVCEELELRGFAEPGWWETTPEETGAAQSRAAVATGAAKVFAWGGDGTVRAVAEPLVGTDVPLAVLPGGTGNLLARNFDIPAELADAVSVAVEGNQRRIDVGTLGDSRFLIMAGMGFDAQMLDDAPEKVKSAIGWMAYLLSACRHLLDRRTAFTITLDDGVPIRRHGRGVLVGNVGQLQGGLPVLPDAVPDDGMLDVAVIRARGLISWAMLAGAVVLRRDTRRLETFRARRVVVETQQPLPTELDGEVIGDRTRLDISVVPGALTLMVP